jgi:hypothetical protein
MKFEKLGFNHIKLLQTAFKAQNDGNSILTIGNFLAFNRFFDFYLITDGVSVLVQGKTWDTHETFYLPPFGANPEPLWSYIPSGAKVKYMLNEEKEYINDAFHDNNLDDYVYLFEELFTMSGKRRSHMRNHVNRFLATYINYRYEKISLSNITDAKSVLLRQKDSQGFEHLEWEANLFGFENFEKFPFVGGLLYVDNYPVAFSIGEIIGSTLFVQFEKRLDNYEGISDYNRLCFLNMLKSENLTYVNRMEDAGDEGLRTSKSRMGPCFMKEKFVGIKK